MEHFKAQSAIQLVEPNEVSKRISAGDTFIVNVVATWCPDCTERQKLYIDDFAQKMKLQAIDVLQVIVQRVKGEFIDDEHAQLTAKFGGHGYPRTVLICQGNIVDSNNVEIITEDTLSALAEKFTQIINES